MNGPNNKIGYCDFTANPIRGKCLHACPHCYAEAMRKRFGWPEKISWNQNWFSPKQCDNFFKTNHRWPRIFVGSMHDLLGRWIDEAYIKSIIKTMRIFHFVTFQILTQNPARYSEFDWPDNCWLGTTVRTQKEADERIPLLLKAKSRIKFLSIEPILEMMNVGFGKKYFCSHCKDYFNQPYCAKGRIILGRKTPIDWVIVGCATDSRAKNCKLEWIESIVEQCDTAGVPVFVKQIYYNGKVVKDINLFPKNLQYRQFPLDK